MAGISNLTVNERLVKIAVLSEFMHKTLFTRQRRRQRQRRKICVFDKRLWTLARHHFQLRGTPAKCYVSATVSREHSSERGHKC